ncbi:MaoC family dehydratase [Marinobacter sp. ANT_B65]|uniref:MaoC family dehydratase n=1 Tax=Marinobacter sp. ANT_B65 TaxID=2039467 RepID=UPI000BBEC51B|nr:MaoC family dehydratase [Marinobacter sp. ANT_B65]PCM44396.1 enoyl-CoA hydratase [Marinobacter sp. ANT_B65]
MKEIPLGNLADYKGKLCCYSPWLTITQEMIGAFADATGDHQWIHVDVERAKRESPWKSPVAHGYLTVSLIPRLNPQALRVTGTTATINYGSNKLRFPAAVPVGSEIRTRIELIDVTPAGDNRTLAAYKTTIEIKGQDKPACVTENLAMYVA